MKKLFLLILFFSLESFSADINSIISKIPVHENGRIKPFDSFASESLQLIYGKKTYNGKRASEVVLTWLLLPEHWDNIDFVSIKNLELKKLMKVDETKDFFSPQDLLLNERLNLLFSDLDAKQKNKEKLGPTFEAVLQLQNGLTLYKAITHGMVPHVIPQKDNNAWLSLMQMNENQKVAFAKIAEGFVHAIKEGGNTNLLSSAVDEFINLAKEEAPANYADPQKIKIELFYNNFHPFQKAWILYLVSAVLALIYLISNKHIFSNLSFVTIMIAFLLHTLGFVLRVVIADRPPVSNMYETVVWVPWASVLFALIFYKMLRNKYLLFCGSIIAFICLVIADSAPTVLDSSVQPLQAVLRTNYWLIIHVITITLSYGAFFLAFILGDIGIIFYLIDENKKQKELMAIRDTIYRTIQVGVVLLAAGTILGGVWADASWGRFWGWDPKETWAFISLLGYLAILHGRLAGWVGTYAFMNLAVITFNLVVMAWYGVNFVLGKGKHSYGFGGGGVKEVSMVIAIQLLFLIFVGAVRYFRKNDLAKKV